MKRAAERPNADSADERRGKDGEKVHPIDEAQLLSHLRLLDLQVGLLINFHEVDLKQGIHRIVNNYQE